MYVDWPIIVYVDLCQLIIDHYVHGVYVDLCHNFSSGVYVDL